ncbi:GntR family transcriptional regulator [Chachezhania sediminis]|uniref:GntR family transcriptional regulator n=1 Tax=Chachezhania sediminis TaxID=2599291 RepID=UPI00131DE9FE|nr:GntR family transcriptional regulator [Chachezhania sediminis]
MESVDAKRAAPPDDPVDELSGASDTGGKVPVHELVYRRLRALILFGDMAPGQAVTIQGLTSQLEAGMTPVREAIRRLISEGGLTFRDNRRVSVPVLSVENIAELKFLRSAIEPELTRLATPRLSVAEIDALERIDTEMDAAIAGGDLESYLKQNHAFHTRIYAAAEAPIMTSTADRLWLRFGPSLRFVCARVESVALPDNHKTMIAAFRAGDAETAALAMRADVLQGMVQIETCLAEDLYKS